MSSEVSININVFRSNISKLKTSASDLQSNIKKNWTFDKTNISPLVDDLENTIKAMEVLERYASLLESDIITMQGIGEEMRETDEKLANQPKPTISKAPEPLR
jgi:type VII secretion effector (TIGR04197 family)